MKVLAVSGYKPAELGIFQPDAKEIDYIKKALEKRIIAFVEEGIEWIVISGQPGVELWTADVVLSLKTTYPELKLAVLTPFLNQQKIWPEQAKQDYEFILSHADFVDSISKQEYDNPGQLRAKNDFIILKTDGLLLLYTEEQEGTPKYYLHSAQRRGEQADYPIFFITPEDLEETAREEKEKEFWGQSDE
ncbi:DUF1273 domain-containing protein [Alteribacillus sp. HJP-4]|uniref:DUF1273 domain-containing protein n=1 Tax=Alteribacillus sp. HJP-4 TaxID=2775394 RepID=UPI0035CD0FE4